MNSAEFHKLRIQDSPMPIQCAESKYMMHCALLDATFLSVLQVHL